MFAFLYVKANSKEIGEEILFPYFFRKNADVSIFVEIQGLSRKKCVATPIFLFGFQ